MAESPQDADNSVDNSDEEQMPPSGPALSREDRHRIFEQRTFVIGAGLVAIAFALQPIMPLLDPLLFALTVISGVVLWFATYQSQVLQTSRLDAKLTILVMTLLVAGSIFLQLAALSERSKELIGACERYRASLLKAPDSPTADAYNALRCPLFTEASVNLVRKAWGF
ncbi:hypothetical protein [Sphingomonas hankookensis]